MRKRSVLAGRARWAAACALALIGGMLVAHRAQAGVVTAPPPAAVSPTIVRLGDALELGQPAVASAADVSGATYLWNFGDASTGVGPQVAHTYAAPGQYTATLTVSGPAGAQSSLTQVVQVRRAADQPTRADMVKPAQGGTAAAAGLTVRLQLLPQGLGAVLYRGVALQVTSTAPANGFATISLSRKLAKLAHIPRNGKAAVVIGSGTVYQVKDGMVTLHLHLAPAVVNHLKHLKHLALTVALSLIDTDGRRVAVEAAGSY